MVVVVPMVVVVTVIVAVAVFPAVVMVAPMVGRDEAAGERTLEKEQYSKRDECFAHAATDR
jgi:beta-lactam-binding protein with PASTA domain